MAPIAIAASSERMPPAHLLALLGSGVILFWATAHNGATEHGGALLLRALVTALVVAAWPRRGFAPRRAAWVAPAAAALVVGIAVMGSDARGLALQAFVSVGLVAALYATTAWGRVPLWPTALAIAASVGGIHALWALGQWLSTGARGRGGFFNPNYLAAWLVPIGLAAVSRLSTSTGRRRVGWAAAAVLAAGGLLASQSRSGLAAAAIGGLLLSLTATRLRRWVLLGALALGLAGGWMTWDRFVGERDPFAYSRAEIWRQSAALGLEHPFGVGLGGYALAMRKRGVPLEGGLVRYPRTARSPHSELLGAWAELGWPGLLILLLAFWPLVDAWGRVDWRRRWSDLAVLAGFATPALVSNSLHVPPVAFLAALWAGHIVRETSPAPPTPSPRTPRRHRWVAAGTVLLTLSAVPGAASWWAMRHADALKAAGDGTAAVRWADRAATLAPWSLATAMYAEGVRFAAGGSAPEVGLRLAELAVRFPEHPDPWEKAAWILETGARHSGLQSDWARAAEVRAEAVQRDPKNAPWRVQLARNELYAGQIDRAKSAAEATLEVEPNCADAMALLAHLAAREGATQRSTGLKTEARRIAGLSLADGSYAARVLSLDDESEKMLRGLTTEDR